MSRALFQVPCKGECLLWELRPWQSCAGGAPHTQHPASDRQASILQKGMQEFQITLMCELFGWPATHHLAL